MTEIMRGDARFNLALRRLLSSTIIFPDFIRTERSRKSRRKKKKKVPWKVWMGSTGAICCPCWRTTKTYGIQRYRRKCSRSREPPAVKSSRRNSSSKLQNALLAETNRTWLRTTVCCAVKYNSCRVEGVLQLRKHLLTSCKTACSILQFEFQVVYYGTWVSIVVEGLTT